MSIGKRTIEDIAKVMKLGKKQKRFTFAFLIGAGASGTAGIPTASGVVEELGREIYRREHPGEEGDGLSAEEAVAWLKGSELYKEVRAQYGEDWGYSLAFRCYSPSTEQRRAFIEDLIRRIEGRINWAHVHLANLITKRWIDVTMTTNFDPLIQRALVRQGTEFIIGDHPSTLWRLNLEIKVPKVVYLHRSYLHYDIDNLQSEVQALAREYESTFMEVARNRGLVVVGYGGNREYVMDMLSRLVESDGFFPHDVYWVYHRTRETLGELPKALLESGRRIYLVENCDADRFFEELARLCQLRLPEYIREPLSFAKKQLESVADLPVPEWEPIGPSERPLVGEAESPQFIRQAIDDLQFLIQRRSMVLAQREKVEQARTLVSEATKAQIEGSSEEARTLLTRATKVDRANADAWLRLANVLDDMANEKKGKERKELLKEAVESYQEAAELNPDDAEPYILWANVLISLSWITDAQDPDGLLHQAVEKCEKARQLGSDRAWNYAQWGLALSCLGVFKDGKERPRLQKEASEKYEKATKLGPDNFSYLHNWGIALHRLAREEEGEQRQVWLREAVRKHEMSNELRPSHPATLMDWGYALAALVRVTKSPERDELIEEALEKVGMSLDLEPEPAGAGWSSYAYVLGTAAGLGQGEEREELFEQAFAGFERSERLGHRPHGRIEFYEDWAEILRDYAKTKRGKARGVILEHVKEKEHRAEELRKGKKT